ncbi:zinc ribbon domain-containing protein [Candidatus Saccharibacteria bacterium]|nr:zinc ribbon domain-containing protein [Candidatus Saccharibacteria bacterium]
MEGAAQEDYGNWVICQSCSGPISGPQALDKGTNENGTPNEEYCIYCFKDGVFTSNMTLDEMIADSVNYAEMADLSKEEMLEHARKTLPTLKRWKQA